LNKRHSSAAELNDEDKRELYEIIQGEK